MNFDNVMKIQSDLNDFTLESNDVCFAGKTHKDVQPELVEARMSLAQREGEFIRHSTPLIQMIDMYQWAGDREVMELVECFMPIPPTEIKEPRKNARIEVVDVMHFDLSVLTLTKVRGEEIAEFLQENENRKVEIQNVILARKSFSDLQLRKWWTSNKVNIAEIRDKAIIEFGSLLLFATKEHVFGEDTSLFDSLEDVEHTYLKKVEVNYDRVKTSYDHIADKEAGNDTV